MNTSFTRAISAYGHSPLARPMLAKASLHATGKFATTLTSARSFQDLRSLRIPGSLPEQPIDFYGQSALNKAGLSAQALSASGSAWEAGLAHLNAAAAKGPPLARQLKLTRTDSVALALAFIQAGSRLKLDIDSPAVVSVIYNLLASLPVGADLLARFEHYAAKLTHELIPHTDMLSEALHWPDIASTARLQATRDLFARMYPLTQECGLAPGPEESVTLDWDGDLYRSPIAAGFYLVAIDGRGLQRDPGRVRLSRHLIEDDARNFAAGSKDAAELSVAAPALTIAVLSHEIFHSWQYSLLETLANNLPPSAQIVKTATSIGCQSAIAAQNLGTDIFGDDNAHTRLLPHLPHEKEAWALTFIVIRAMHNNVSVPGRYKAALKNYLLNNFDVFARCISGAPAPRPTLPSGELWNRSGDLCIDTRDFDAAWKVAEIASFLSHGGDHARK